MRFRGRAGSIRVVAATAVALGGFALVGGVAASSAGAATPAGCPPKITKILPVASEKAGLTKITITGVCVGETNAVHFGATAGSFVRKSSSVIVASPPQEAAGAVSVSVTTPSGADGPGGTSTVANGYHYYAPSISSITPNHDGIHGGKVITIRGTSLGVFGAAPPTVKFGSTLGTGVTVNKGEQSLTVTVPAHNAGKFNVTITTVAGSNAATANSAFTYTYTV